MPSFAAGKLDDVIRHGQRSRGRGCGEAVLHQVVFGELLFQEGLGFGMSLAAYPTWSGSYEFPGVGEGTITVKVGQRAWALASPHIKQAENCAQPAS